MEPYLRVQTRMSSSDPGRRIFWGASAGWTPPARPAGWGPGVTDTQFARVYIGQIRQKLEGDPSAPGFILTESGIGYRLVAED